jgi:hypothetical protein
METVLAQIQPFPPSEKTDGTDEASTQEINDREVVIAYLEALKEKKRSRTSDKIIEEIYTDTHTNIDTGRDNIQNGKMNDEEKNRYKSKKTYKTEIMIKEY